MDLKTFGLFVFHFYSMMKGNIPFPTDGTEMIRTESDTTIVVYETTLRRETLNVFFWVDKRPYGSNGESSNNRLLLLDEY
jgi:hypothetical protein